MKISIHQPNFMPWLGYFNKALRSDVFVLFDDVQFPRGKTFGNRVLIKTSNGENWLTIPLSDKSDLLNFNQIKINYSTEWQSKFNKTIIHSYSKAKYFNLYFDDISQILNTKHELLFDLNYNLLKYYFSILNASCKLVLSSEISDNKIAGHEKILSILEYLNATEYITGEGLGSLRYVDESDFSARNIKLTYQKFKHPEYSQLWKDFIPNMSVLDIIFNCGPGSKNIILND